ncbi:MAG TPA: hypothetical protein VI316_13110 [Candidatus Dormibacteraeota bacterium]
MPESVPCPRCSAARLSVVYFDADGRPVGGHLHCTQCGPRHNQLLVPNGQRGGVQKRLLERKAS